MTDKRLVAGRAGRRAAQRDDHRHRRMGIAAQADGRRPGHPPLRSRRPDRRLLRRARCRPAVRGRQGGQGGVRVRHPRLDPHRPPLQGGPPDRGRRGHGDRRGDVLPGPAGRLPAGPFLPTRAGLGSDVLRVNPSLRTVTSPYDDGEELVAMPALRLDAAVVHVNRADANGSGQILGPDPFFDELFLGPPIGGSSPPSASSTPTGSPPRVPSRPCASAGC